MFLPDPKRTYTGKQVYNIRIPLKKDPRLRELINLQHEMFKIMNEGDLAYRTGMVEVDRAKLMPVLRRITELRQRLGIPPPLL
jgi:hypothetical protein